MAPPPEVELEPLEYPLRCKTWVLKVSIHCEGCKRKVKRILHAVEGVYTVDVETKLHKVIVTGNVDANTLIRKLENSGKHAELWPEQYNNCGRRGQRNDEKPLPRDEDNSNQQPEEQEEGPQEQETPNAGGGGPPPSGPRESDQTPPSPQGHVTPHPRGVQFINSVGGNPHAEVQTRGVRFDGKRPDNIPPPAGQGDHPPYVGQGGGGGGASAPNGNGGGGGGAKKKKKKKRSNSNIAAGGANTPNPTNDNAGGGEGGGPPPNGAPPQPSSVNVLQNPVDGTPPQNAGPPPEHLVNAMGPQPQLNHNQMYDYPPPPSHCAPHYPSPVPPPPMNGISYNTAYPASAYTASYYAAPPPDSFAYVHQAGDVEHVILPSYWNGSQAPPPSNTFEIFSDENPNACSVM